MRACWGLFTLIHSQQRKSQLPSGTTAHDGMLRALLICSLL